MTLNISSVFTYDEDAGNYIQAVEGASGDNQALEPAVRQAINNFVVGCKQDGIWDAIKASCILAGARTLNGALQPLVGTAPNKYGTEGNWNYNRKTGLQGDGSTNYLNTNRGNNSDPQNNQHLALYSLNTPGSGFMSSDDSGTTAGMSLVTGGNSRSRTTSNTLHTATTPFRGVSRSDSGFFNYRINNSTLTASVASQNPTSSSILIYRVTASGGSFVFSSASVSFYSIGESLDLAKLDSRVTDLITAFGAAIP